MNSDTSDKIKRNKTIMSLKMNPLNLRKSVSYRIKYADERRWRRL